MRERLSHCAEQVRRLDPDRYLCSLFAPAGRREGLFALYAFNAEIATARESTHEPMLGQLRLQWWRDAVAGIYRGVPVHHPVVEALAGVVGGHGLDRAVLDALIDARERDFDAEPPATLVALEAYAEATSAALTGLVLEVLGAGSNEAARRAGRLVAIAWALSGLLRAVPFHARARRLYLPAELLAANGVDAEVVFALRSGAGLEAVVATLADVAGGHLSAARALRHEVPRPALPALLPASLATSDLGRLARTGHDVFDPRIAAGGVGRRLRLVLNALLQRY